VALSLLNALDLIEDLQESFLGDLLLRERNLFADNLDLGWILPRHIPLDEETLDLCPDGPSVSNADEVGVHAVRNAWKRVRRSLPALTSLMMRLSG